MKKIIFNSLLKIWDLLPLKKYILLFLKSFFSNFDKYYRDFWFKGFFYVKNYDFKLYSTKYDKGSLDIFWNGLDNSWDAFSIKIWSELAKNASIIIDIGANIGLYSIVAKKINKKSKVFAIEPSKSVLSVLYRNIKINNIKINVREIALSDINGEIAFFDFEKSSALSSFKIDNKTKDSSIKQYNVKTRTLSEFVRIEKIDKVDLVSIDVERNEPEVLEGMGNLISLFKPDFIVEVLNYNIGEQIEKYFDKSEYDFYEINEYSKQLFKRPHLKRQFEFQENSFNFLICKKETSLKIKKIFHNH